jgi:GNAT superfamily N-acetyltransferase
MTEFRVEIRAAVPHDSVGLARVQVETWRDAYVGILPDGTLLDLDETRAAVRWGHMVGAQGPSERLSVAECDGRLIGFCHGGPTRAGLQQAVGDDRDLDDFEDLAEIYALYMEPDFQGMGLGRALLLDVTKHLLLAGFDALGAITLVGNHHARRFYEDLGGTSGEEIPSIVAGSPADQVAYVWPEIEALAQALETVDG